MQRYKSRGVNVDPKNILITQGSQQLGFAGKAFLNKGDYVCLERRAILVRFRRFKCFSLIPRSRFNRHSIDLLMEKQMAATQANSCIAIPNFQNPNSLTYSVESRQNLPNTLKTQRQCDGRNDLMANCASL